MGIEVIRPGLLTTVQDQGRDGWRKYGVPGGGAMDRGSLRVANWLVGNDGTAAGLEATLLGPTLRFTGDHWVAICGAEMPASLDGRPFPMGRPQFARAGAVLRLEAALSGCRSYLAVRGGIDVPVLLGSRSTLLTAGFGGFQGRAVRAGDHLQVCGVPPPSAAGAPTQLSTAPSDADLSQQRWQVGNWESADSQPVVIRVCRGRHVDWFQDDSLHTFYSSPYVVTDEADRVGYRLAGTPLTRRNAAEIFSEATFPGTIQVPANGQPIVLLADAPVTGGYPKLGQVATVDLDRLAQLRPGMQIRFCEITPTAATQLLRDRERALARLKWGLRWKGWGPVV